jgi:hypothetical protein
MIIKKYIQFIKESINGHKYGCVMIEIPISNWDEITSSIDPEDVYTESNDGEPHGIQEDPHLTLLYGLHDNVTPEMVKSIFDNFSGDISIKVNGIGIFENKDFDVVKFNVVPEGSLQKLHDELSKFPNSNQSPDYKPHITIAYLKKGTGKKYIKPDYKYEVKNVNKITYSMPDGSKNKFEYRNINELFSFNSMLYDAEWKLPTSKIRLEIDKTLREILLEITDMGYSPSINGFIVQHDYKGNITNSKPYVWIKNKKRLSHDRFWNEISDTVERIKDYLKIEGFEVDQDILNEGSTYEQVYIYFDKKEEEINENKMWYKSIPQILEWLESKSKMPWLFMDVETTGLGGPKMQQLTQVSCIATDYNFNSNSFKELSLFDEKIKLTDDTKSKYTLPSDKTKWVLGFNRYGSGNYKYKNEQDTLDQFFNWIGNYEPCLYIAQNAGFDMSMLAGRYGHKIKNEVFDTKMLIQLYYLPLLQTLSEKDIKYKEIINSIGNSQRDGGLISSSMSKIGPALGINMSGYHDALTDVKITIEMYKKIINFLQNHKNIDIMKYQLERIKVIKKNK